MTPRLAAVCPTIHNHSIYMLETIATHLSPRNIPHTDFNPSLKYQKLHGKNTCLNHSPVSVYIIYTAIHTPPPLLPCL